MTIITLYTQCLRQHLRKRNQIPPYRVVLKNLNTNFQYELISKLNARSSDAYCTFEKIFIEVLDKQAPQTRKILLGNQKAHVNKTLHFTILKRSQLQNKAIKSN